jgi:hypothetical protein
VAISKDLASMGFGEDLLLPCSSGLEKVDSLMWLNSARKLVADMSSIISPLTSASSMSGYEKWSLTRDMSSVILVSGLISMSVETEEPSKASQDRVMARVNGSVVLFRQA